MVIGHDESLPLGGVPLSEVQDVSPLLEAEDPGIQFARNTRPTPAVHAIPLPPVRPEALCDIAFVSELHGIANRAGYLPRPLQWAEYVIRVRAGGPWSGMPLPSPGDALGLMSTIAAPCW